MTNRERIWRRACSWVRGWQGGKSTPTPEMAYIAGWQAAMREIRKRPANTNNLRRFGETQMHYHCEIVIPPTMNIEEAIASVMKPFNEQPDDDEDSSRNGFWDFWLIGGRWAGHKLLAKYDQTKLDEFHAWLKEEHVTVSGLQCGKQQLSPATQIPKVDAKWNEMFPSGEFLPCPLFNHSNDQYGKGLSGTLPGDVQRLVDVPAALACSRVIFAKPNGEEGKPEAEFMLVDDAWNGCNHMKVDWDGKFHTALEKYRESIKNYREEYVAKIAPTDDWLVVTVDYHS